MCRYNRLLTTEYGTFQHAFWQHLPLFGRQASILARPCAASGRHTRPTTVPACLRLQFSSCSYTLFILPKVIKDYGRLIYTMSFMLRRIFNDAISTTDLRLNGTRKQVSAGLSQRERERERVISEV